MLNRLFRCFLSEDDEPLTVHSYIAMRKWKIYKNLICLSVSQSVIYLMYKMMMMLREYEHDFLGLWNYAMFSCSKIFSFIIIPQFVLPRCSLRNTIRWGMLISALLIFITYIKSIRTVIPAAISMGFFMSTTWISVQFYVYKLSRIMSKISGDDLQLVLLRFSGIFFSIYRSYDVLCYLPISFGIYDSLSEFTLPPSNESSYIASISVIFLAFCALLLSISIIDPTYKLTATHLGYEDNRPNLSRIIYLFKRRRLQLMVPMSIFAGSEKIIKIYDFATAYVGCTESAVHSVYVYFIGSLASSQISLALAPLVEVTNLQIILAIAAITHFILFLVLLLKSDISLIDYYVISATWGLSSSIWDCLLYVLYGMLSPGYELEAYCHFGFWYSIGAFGNLLIAKFLSVSFQLWTGFVCLILSSLSVLLLPYIIGYTPTKITPVDVRVPSAYSGSETTKKTSAKSGVYFEQPTTSRQHNPPEVKSITTSRIHHISIPRTRPRFDRHEASNEDSEP